MTTCLICEEKSFSALYDGLLQKCRSCGFITANFDMQRFDADEIYTESYFNGSEYENYVRDRDVFLYNFKKRIQFLGRREPGRLFENVLEIGCAYGFFGLALKDFSPTSAYTGIDITPAPVQYGKKELGLNLICGDYLTFKSPGNFSDVFMWDVIEHLPSPDRFLEKIRGDLAPSGRLYLTTGDVSALLPRVQGRRWRMIHPPSHLHYFSAKTISELLHKQGFHVRSITYPAVNRSLKQIYFSLFLLNKAQHSFHKAIHRWIPEGINVPINTRDIMLVIADKA